MYVAENVGVGGFPHEYNNSLSGGGVKSGGKRWRGGKKWCMRVLELGDWCR